MQTAGAVNAGEYKVVAKFENSNANYETIPDMEATLTIAKAKYVISGVDIVFERSDGKAIDGKLKTYDGSAVTFDISDYSKISNNVSVLFSVSDESGEVISSSNKETNILAAGVYTVKADFVLADNKNYEPIDPLVCEFEVKKAKYDTTEIHFDNDVVVYDGEEHSLSVALPIDHDIKAEDISYEYYLDGELLADEEGNPIQSVSQAGEYKVKAIFAEKDANFEQISDMEATLRIENAN